MSQELQPHIDVLTECRKDAVKLHQHSAVVRLTRELLELEHRQRRVSREWTRKPPTEAGVFYALSPANDCWDVVHWSPDGEGGGAVTLLGQNWESAHAFAAGEYTWLWGGEVPQPHLPTKAQYDLLMGAEPRPPKGPEYDG